MRKRRLGNGGIMVRFANHRGTSIQGRGNCRSTKEINPLTHKELACAQRLTNAAIKVSRILEGVPVKEDQTDSEGRIKCGSHRKKGEVRGLKEAKGDF